MNSPFTSPMDSHFAFSDGPSPSILSQNPTEPKGMLHSEYEQQIYICIYVYTEGRELKYKSLEASIQAFKAKKSKYTTIYILPINGIPTGNGLKPNNAASRSRSRLLDSKEVQIRLSFMNPFIYLLIICN